MKGYFYSLGSIFNIGVEAVIKDGIQLLLRLGGWLGGWLENRRVMLISTQIVVKVEVEVDIGKIYEF